MREKDASYHGLGQMSKFRNPEADVKNAKRSEGWMPIFPQWCFPSTLTGSISPSEDTTRSCDTGQVESQHRMCFKPTKGESTH